VRPAFFILGRNTKKIAACQNATPVLLLLLRGGGGGGPTLQTNWNSLIRFNLTEIYAELITKKFRYLGGC
jgi:hypothetical protein